ncbi:MAG: hypothetical protein K2Y23_10035 [Cyanobacteria bacterium]|nr:hypothetical protein [Cyanobacteriota bacterium]
MLILLMVITRPSAAFDLQAYYATRSTQTLEVFVANFPFEQYLQTTRFTDFAELQRDRLFLYQRLGDGDLFLYHLGNFFVRKYPVDPALSALTARTAIAEEYLARHPQFSTGTDDIYHIIGYFLLGTVGREIERQIAARTFDRNNRENVALLERLEKNKVHVALEESTGAKIGTAITSGNFGYLFTRATDKLIQHSRVILVFCVTFAIVLFVAWRVFSVPAFGAGGILVVVVTIVVVLVTGVPTFKPLAPSTASAATQLRTSFTLSDRQTSFQAPAGAALETYRLLDGTKAEIGHAMWLPRTGFVARYMAEGNVPQKYSRLRSNRRILLAVSGGFTNISAQPRPDPIQWTV